MDDPERREGRGKPEIRTNSLKRGGRNPPVLTAFITPRVSKLTTVGARSCWVLRGSQAVGRAPPMLPHPVCGQAGGPQWLLAMGVPPHPPGTLGLSFAEAGARVRLVSGAQTRPRSGAQRCCKVQELPWGAAEQRPALKGRVLASPPCLSQQQTQRAPGLSVHMAKIIIAPSKYSETSNRSSCLFDVNVTYECIRHEIIVNYSFQLMFSYC